MALRILRPGPFSTIQDLGRRGYMKDGFPQSGVMDDYSFLQANRLLGNDKNAAAIEMTLMGLAAAFTEDTDFVAAGGDFGAALDDIPIAPNMLYHAKAGAVITFGAAKTGCRCYLAVAGGFDVPPVMGSRSTTVKCRIGGMDGRKLQSGDLLPIGKASCTPSPVGTQFDNPMPDGTLTIRAVPGPQDDLFTEEDLRLFFSQVYTITPESDRMGMRLAGDTPLKGKRGTDAAERKERHGYHIRRHCLWGGAGAVLRSADCADGRPADRGRLCENRHGYQLRFAFIGTGKTGADHSVYENRLNGSRSGGAGLPSTVLKDRMLHFAPHSGAE